MSSVLSELAGGTVGQAVRGGSLLSVPRLLAALSNIHCTESQPGGLLVKLVHLSGLPLVQESDALLALLSELAALLLHLLTQQRAPPLAVRRHPGLALVGRQDLQLPLQPVRQQVGLLLLGLVQANRLFLKNLRDGLLILLTKQSHLPSLFFLQLLEDNFLFILGRSLDHLGLERLVLSGLYLASVAELLPDQDLLLF